MQDLVQMMTQTLRMDIEDSVNEADKGIFGLTALPEFKLNGKYRDTLALHGKSGEEAQGLFRGKIPLGSMLLTISNEFIDWLVSNQHLSHKGSTSGPAKIRRAIEQLRTDVVKGLGIKLLDSIMEIMEEEDDNKREVGVWLIIIMKKPKTISAEIHRETSHHFVITAMPSSPYGWWEVSSLCCHGEAAEVSGGCRL